MRPTNALSSSKLLLALLLVLHPSPSSAIEPFTFGATAGIFGFSSILYAGWDKVKCQFEECCSQAYIPNNLTHFQG